MKVPGRVLVLGATSGIGRAFAREMAARGWPVVLAGRDTDELNLMADDLRIRHSVAVQTVGYEATDFDGHAGFFAQCLTAADTPLGAVVFCQGTLIGQDEAERDLAAARRMIDVNYTSAVSLLGLAAAHFASKKTGCICAVSSVAGDRGRQSNFLYGSTKAALTAHLQGLRNRLFRAGVAVVTIKPGFVDTAMTWGLVNPASPLVASPKRVARDMARAIERRANVVYSPWFWRWIMAIIRAIPEPLFKRMKL